VLEGEVYMVVVSLVGWCAYHVKNIRKSWKNSGSYHIIFFLY